MSALLVDEMFLPLPTRPQPTGWRHVAHDAQPRPQLCVVREPASAVRDAVRPRPVGQAAPLRLTDRGIAVVVVFFLALVATAAIVLVTSFLGVSNEPIQPSGVTPALVTNQG
ncbi:MAG: hypothetical protein ACOH1Y_09525 [Propionicimonas sp.]